MKNLTHGFVTAVLALSAGRALAKAPVGVYTQHNDVARTGAYLSERILNTSNVNPKTFGKLFTRPVEGHIYAQPLYVPALRLPDGRERNVVVVATQANRVYAFDADDADAAEPLWSVKLGEPLRLPVISCEQPDAEPLECDFGGKYGPYTDIQEQVGISSTPVIDPATSTLYVVSFSHPDRKTFQHHLHALDLRTGEARPGSPRLIEATVAGRGDSSVGGVVHFESRRQLQRTGLLLDHGRVTFAFASYGDTKPYHGWVLSYDAATLEQVGVFNNSPDGSDGGIWQSGNGLAADERGDIYGVSGNGDTDGWKKNGRAYGDSAFKLSYRPGVGLRVVDYFTPYNYERLDELDADLGSSGIMLLPGTRLALFGSKEGKIYVTRQDDLGKLHRDEHGRAIANDHQITQVFQATDLSQKNHNIHGTPITWLGPKGRSIYVWGEQTKLRAFHFESEAKGFDPKPSSQSQHPAPDGMPGGILSLSADGAKAGTGIVWATHAYADDATLAAVEGSVEAYDASDVSRLLWSSRQVLDRDAVGNFAKFSPPTVAGGKVYVGTFSNQLVVYGLLPR